MRGGDALDPGTAGRDIKAGEVITQLDAVRIETTEDPRVQEGDHSVPTKEETIEDKLHPLRHTLVPPQVAHHPPILPIQALLVVIISAVDKQEEGRRKESGAGVAAAVLCLQEAPRAANETLIHFFNLKITTFNISLYK